MIRLLVSGGKALGKLINYAVIGFILVVRSFLGPAKCRYKVGCTQYAVNQLKERPLFPALWAITKRVLSCNPFNRLPCEE